MFMSASASPSGNIYTHKHWSCQSRKQIPNFYFYPLFFPMILFFWASWFYKNWMIALFCHLMNPFVFWWKLLCHCFLHVCALYFFLSNLVFWWICMMSLDGHYHGDAHGKGHICWGAQREPQGWWNSPSREAKMKPRLRMGNLETKNNYHVSAPPTTYILLLPRCHKAEQSQALYISPVLLSDLNTLHIACHSLI